MKHPCTRPAADQNEPADFIRAMTYNREILCCTVLCKRDSAFNLLSASFPIKMRLISLAHGSINCSAIVCGFWAFAICFFLRLCAALILQYEIASHNLPFAQKISLCSQCVLFLNSVFSVLMVSWIQTKELSCSVHTVVFHCSQRWYWQIHTWEWMQITASFYHNIIKFNLTCKIFKPNSLKW